MASKDEQSMEKAPVKGKTGMKLYIIVAVAVALAVGGTAAFFMLSGGERKKAGDVRTESKAAPAIFPLEPFIVNIYDGQELRYLRIKVEMEVANEEAKSELTAKQAQMRDTILVLLTTKTMLDIRDQQGKNQLRQEIFNAVGRIVSPGKVQKIYFTDFVVQ